MSQYEPEPLVLLHGFAGTRRTWDGVLATLDPKRYRPLAVDLRGHGDRARARPISWEASVGDVIAAAPARFVLGGYSLGARVALHVALAYPDRVARLALIGVNPGIEDVAERARRRQAEEILAAEIERHPIEWFTRRWRQQPLFAQDPDWVARLAAKDYERNHPVALAACLRALGTGSMTPLWDRLCGLDLPVLMLAGERDEKFRALGERMARALPQGAARIVPGGHAAHLEHPGAIAGMLCTA